MNTRLFLATAILALLGASAASAQTSADAQQAYRAGDFDKDRTFCRNLSRKSVSPPARS